MKAEDLEKRIAKKEADIEKINKRIKKWSSQCTEEEINVAHQFKNDYKGFVNYHKERNLGWTFTPVAELRSALIDLDENNVTLAKYKNALALEQSKEQTTKVQVIVDFLEQWKQDVRDFVQEDVKNADKYYEYQHEYCDLHNHHYAFINSGEMTEEEWKEKMAEVRENEKFYKTITTPITFEVWNKVTEDHINHKQLDEILDKEAEAKYWNMIEKVTKITGEITDASALKIARDGNLNGIIVGDNGKARLETIRTTGENAGRLVNVKRGSIAHFRLLVNEVK